jgi:hypothetical protein
MKNLRRRVFFVCLIMLAGGFLALVTAWQTLAVRAQSQTAAPRDQGKLSSKENSKHADLKTRLGELLPEAKLLFKQMNSQSAVKAEIGPEMRNASSQLRPAIATVGGETCASAPLFTTSFTDSDTTTGHSDDLDPATANTCGFVDGGFLVYTESGLGPDVVYRFNSPVSGVATAVMTAAADLGIYVLTPASACAKPTTTGCIVLDDTDAGGVPERVTFSVTAGVDYFLVVDGFNGQNGPFTLDLTFSPGPVIVCPGPYAVSTTGNSLNVFYPDPISSPTAGTVTCIPPQGAIFPVGTTTVTCTSSGGGNCSFPLTVNRMTNSLSDPLECTGPGNALVGTATVTNAGATPAFVFGFVFLPANALALPGTCQGNISNCTAATNGRSFSFFGTVAAGQTITINYQAQAGAAVTPNTNLCSDLFVFFAPPGGEFGDVFDFAESCVTVNCPAVGPGLLPGTGEVSDQKAGSVLFYNLHSSSVAAPNAQNTRINITNTHPALPVAVHLFFVDGATCSIADSLICLTANQTASFLASDIDPGTTGYILAVASDLVTGCPISFNFLIGDEYVKLSSGHEANLAAEGFAAIAGRVATCNASSVTAILNFDGVNYNRAPRVLAASNIPSRADGNDTLLVLNRVGGSLVTGAATLTNLFGILYDDAENPLSFTFSPGMCQFRSSLSSNFPRIAPRFDQFIPAGRSGWAKFYATGELALLGAQLNYNPSAGTAANAFNQGHNLHKLTLTASTQLTIPIFPPNC